MERNKTVHSEITFNQIVCRPKCPRVEESTISENQDVIQPWRGKVGRVGLGSGTRLTHCFGRAGLPQGRSQLPQPSILGFLDSLKVLDFRK
jgi:hypothetical protein